MSTEHEDEAQEGDWVQGADGKWYPPETAVGALEEIGVKVRETLRSQLEAPRPAHTDDVPYVPATPVIAPHRLAIDPAAAAFEARRDGLAEDQDLLQDVARNPALRENLSPLWREVVDTLRRKQLEATQALEPAKEAPPAEQAQQTSVSSEAALEPRQAAIAVKTAKTAKASKLAGRKPTRPTAGGD